MTARRERCLREQGSRVEMKIRGQEMRHWAHIILNYNPQKQSLESAHQAKVVLDPRNFSRQDARIKTMEEIDYHY